MPPWHCCILLPRRSTLFWIDIAVFLIHRHRLPILIPFFIKVIGKKKSERHLFQKKKTTMFSTKQKSFFPTPGSPTRTPISESRYNWDAIVQFAETPDSYYLYTNSYHAIVIPKRVVADDDEIKEAERTVRHPSSPGCVIVIRNPGS